MLFYPHYLRKFPIYFPGDCQNVITAGACTKYDSNWIGKNHPSPFTGVGPDEKSIKPDVIFDGGNLNLINNNDGTFGFDHKDVRIKSASFNDPLKLSEGVGTSFSSPAIATIAGNILQRYSYASPFLVKALILASASLLTGINA